MSKEYTILEKEYGRLLKRQRTGMLVSSILGAFLIVSLFASLSILGSITDKNLLQNLWWNVPLFVGMAIPIPTLFKKQPNYIFTNQELLFFKFFSLYKKIESLNLAIDKYKDSSFGSRGFFILWVQYMIAKRSFNFLVFYIDSWTYSRTPSVFQEIPNSISRNLREKILPIIENKDRTKLEIYSKALETDCQLLVKGEPTYEEWIKLKQQLDELKIKPAKLTPKIKTKPKITIFVFLRPYVNFPIVFGILVAFLLYYNNNPGISIAMSAGASFAGSKYLSDFRKNRVYRQSVNN